MIKKIIYVAIFSLLFNVNKSIAGDIVRSGTVLQEDSYVFTIDEAKSLLKRMEELEKKESLLNEYIKLNDIKSKQINLYEVNYDILDQQIIHYNALISLNEEALMKAKRQNQFNEFKNFGYFSFGVAVTISSLLAADRIGDTMEATY